MYQMFIGSNNETHKVERDKIEALLTEYVDGFTILPAVGFWKGQKEDSVAVLLDVQDIGHIAYRLKKALKQEAIAFQEVPALSFI